ncbi:MAG: PilZ domain-containing protein [Pseudomonadota bacterium]
MVINYDEKRDFQRMPVECDVSFSLEGSSDKFYGKGSDLSAAGVMFSTDQDLPLDSIINLHVLPYIKTVQALTAKAQVIRNEKLADGFLIGVKMYDVQ